MNLLCQHLVSDEYWALVEYIGSRILKCSEKDLPVKHNPYATCVPNMHRVACHDTELGRCGEKLASSCLSYATVDTESDCVLSKHGI
jgi:hypothetical protein